MKALLASVLLLVGCGGMPVQFGVIGLHVDPELAPLVSEFIAIGRSYNRIGEQVNLSVSFVPEIPNDDPMYVTLGQCYMGSGVVQISALEWDYLDDYEREELIFHELGHCVLNREHNEGMFTNGMPASIMYPILVDESWYVPYRNYYINELFTGY